MELNSQGNPEPFVLFNAQLPLEWSEFSGESIEHVVEQMNKGRALVAENYKQLGDAFYTESNSYIYEVLNANPSLEGRVNVLNKFIPGIFELIARSHHHSFADFGAGAGVVCEIVSKYIAPPLLSVTYIDVEGPLSRFADWRFKKHQLDVNMVLVPDHDFVLPDKYDVIFTDAVWEHLHPDKQTRYISQLMHYLNPGGTFIFLADLWVNEEMPMHYRVNMRDHHIQLTELGLTCLFGRDQFASVWTKK